MDEAAVIGFNAELLSLHELKGAISRNKIHDISKAALKAVKFYKHVVHAFEKFVSKCNPDHKLASVYVVDSIVRQSKKANGPKDVYMARFAKVFPSIVKSLFATNPPDQLKIVRVFHIWRGQAVFPADSVAQWLTAVKELGVETDRDRVERQVKGEKADFSVYESQPQVPTTSGDDKKHSANKTNGAAPPSARKSRFEPIDNPVKAASPPVLPQWQPSDEVQPGKLISERALVVALLRAGLEQQSAFARDQLLLSKAVGFVSAAMQERIDAKRKAKRGDIKTLLSADFDYSDEEDASEEKRRAQQQQNTGPPTQQEVLTTLDETLAAAEVRAALAAIHIEHVQTLNRVAEQARHMAQQQQQLSALQQLGLPPPPLPLPQPQPSTLPGLLGPPNPLLALQLQALQGQNRPPPSQMLAAQIQFQQQLNLLGRLPQFPHQLLPPPPQQQQQENNRKTSPDDAFADQMEAAALAQAASQNFRLHDGDRDAMDDGDDEETSSGAALPPLRSSANLGAWDNNGQSSSRRRKRDDRSRSQEKHHRSSRSPSRHRKSGRKSRSRSKSPAKQSRRKLGLPKEPKEQHLLIASRTLTVQRVPIETRDEDIAKAIDSLTGNTPEKVEMAPQRGCAYATFSDRAVAHKTFEKLRSKGDLRILHKSCKMVWGMGLGLGARGGEEWRDFWDEDNGVVEIPYQKLPEAVEGLLAGCWLDVASLPTHLRGIYDENGRSSTGAPLTLSSILLLPESLPSSSSKLDAIQLPPVPLVQPPEVQNPIVPPPPPPQFAGFSPGLPNAAATAAAAAAAFLRFPGPPPPMLQPPPPPFLGGAPVGGGVLMPPPPNWLPSPPPPGGGPGVGPHHFLRGNHHGGPMLALHHPRGGGAGPFPGRGGGFRGGARGGGPPFHRGGGPP